MAPISTHIPPCCYFYSDIDFAHLALAKLMPSISTLLHDLPLDICDAMTAYYLLLRTMNIIIEDCDLDLSRKLDLISNFSNLVNQPGLCIEGVGNTDLTRQLLSNFDRVLSFLQNIPVTHKSIVCDYISQCAKLSYQFLQTNSIQQHQQQQQQQQQTQQHQSQHEQQESSSQPQLSKTSYVATIAQFNEHCRLANGFTFQCCNKLSEQSGYFLHTLSELNTAEYADSTGIFIYKTTCLRNFIQDIMTGRCLWPYEIWHLYAQDLDFFRKYPSHIRSRLVLNHMIYDTFKHGLDSIKYLSIVQHHEPTFRFIAIQVITAFELLTQMYSNQEETFFGTIHLRSGLVCDLLLNCRTFPAAKGYIMKALQGIVQKGMDPELDPVYINATVTPEEVEKARVLYYSMAPLLQSCRDQCLGYEVVTAGWGGFAKLCCVGVAATAAFLYLTDYNSYWDDEVALRPYTGGRRGQTRHGRLQQHADGILLRNAHGKPIQPAPAESIQRGWFSSFFGSNNDAKTTTQIKEEWETPTSMEVSQMSNVPYGNIHEFVRLNQELQDINNTKPSTPLEAQFQQDRLQQVQQKLLEQLSGRHGPKFSSNGGNYPNQSDYDQEIDVLMDTLRGLNDDQDATGFLSAQRRPHRDRTASYYRERDAAPHDSIDNISLDDIKSMDDETILRLIDDSTHHVHPARSRPSYRAPREADIRSNPFGLK